MGGSGTTTIRKSYTKKGDLITYVQIVEKRKKIGEEDREDPQDGQVEEPIKKGERARLGSLHTSPVTKMYVNLEKVGDDEYISKLIIETESGSAYEIRKAGQ